MTFFSECSVSFKSKGRVALTELVSVPLTVEEPLQHLLEDPKNAGYKLCPRNRSSCDLEKEDARNDNDAGGKSRHQKAERRQVPKKSLDKAKES